MLTFKEFIAENRPGIGPHGENSNDKSEKAMINRIIEIVFQNVRSDENYKTAYDFLESDWGGALWDKYYELFHTKSPDFEGPPAKPRFTRFKNEAREHFNKFKKKVPFTGTPVKEDVFAKGDELLAAVNNDTHPRASDEKHINTNRRPLGSQTGTTRGIPVFYAFSYKPSEVPGGSTELLKSFKGKGPFKFPEARREKFIADTTTHMAAELKKMKRVPDVIATPQSTSTAAAEFAEALASKLGVEAKKIGAFKKTPGMDVTGDKDATRAEIMKHHIDMEYFDEKFTGDEESRRTTLRDLTSAIIRSIKRHGYIVAKEINKPHLKFVKNIMQPDLHGDDEYSLMDKDVMIVDDVLSSGGTMSDLFRAAKELGAASVFGCTLFARTST
jgi:hypothetical protein